MKEQYRRSWTCQEVSKHAAIHLSLVLIQCSKNEFFPLALLSAIEGKLVDKNFLNLCVFPRLRIEIIRCTFQTLRTIGGLKKRFRTAV